MFARDAQLGKDKTPDDFKTMGKDVFTGFSEGQADWAAFCMFPDVLPPTRMPAHFPVHSHIVKRQTTFNIIPGSNASQGLMGVWVPDAVWNRDGAVAVPPLSVASGPAHSDYNGAGLFVTVEASVTNQSYADSNLGISGAYNIEGPVTPTAAEAFGYLSGAISTTAPVITLDLAGAVDSTLVLPLAGATPGLVFYNTPGVTSSVAHGGQRIIGAFIEFEYIGTTLNHAGTIEVGLHYHAISTPVDARTVHFMSSSEIIQAPYYKRFKPIDGARCVWFPIDNNDYTFKKTNQDGSFAFQSAHNNVMRPGNPMRLEWGINFLGFQPNQPVRVHMTSFYETIPDERDRDLYNTSTYKGKSSVANSQQVVSQAINSGYASTAAKSSWYADIGNTINKIFDLTNKVAPGIANIVPGYNIANAANQFLRNM